MNSLAVKTFHVLLPSTSERQSGHTHQSLHLENEAFSQTYGVFSTFLSGVPSLGLLLPQLIWSQGQGSVGSFKLHRRGGR